MRFLNHPATLLVLRFTATLLMSVWVGGFMFYGGIVIPILDAEFGQLVTGMSVTRYVTANLNLIGFSTVILWAGFLLVEGNTKPFWLAPVRAICWLASTLSVFFLMVMHAVMADRLDRYGVRDFKPYHRLYLMVSTGQWLSNLALIALTIRIWTGWGRVQSPQDPSQDSTPCLG